mmetsp:Transcript_25217/g.34674  ORF Transcript_25217/g.34674 Transcript_25217/m.34674 type:complete len:133 (+) Transcript_25217:904-1302(+)
MDPNDPKTISPSISSASNGTMNELLWGGVQRSFLTSRAKAFETVLSRSAGSHSKAVVTSISGRGGVPGPVTSAVLPWQHVDNTASVGHTTSAATVYVVTPISLYDTILMQQSAQSAQALTRPLRLCKGSVRV